MGFRKKSIQADGMLLEYGNWPLIDGIWQQRNQTMSGRYTFQHVGRMVILDPKGRSRSLRAPLS